MPAGSLTSNSTQPVMFWPKSSTVSPLLVWSTVGVKLAFFTILGPRRAMSFSSFSVPGRMPLAWAWQPFWLQPVTSRRAS